jgi:hypothetical protein
MKDSFVLKKLQSPGRPAIWIEVTEGPQREVLVPRPDWGKGAMERIRCLNLRGKRGGK